MSDENLNEEEDLGTIDDILGTTEDEDIGQEEDVVVEINATDSAKKLAEENNIDLTDVVGSGDEGRITKPDVQKLVDDLSEDEEEAPKEEVVEKKPKAAKKKKALDEDAIFRWRRLGRR